MINLIVRYCLQKRYSVIVVSILVALFGYYSWTRMAVEAYPELGDVQVQVTTQAPGLAAEEIEQQITVPLERALGGTPGLVHMRSSSTFGLSLITLTFKEGAEDYWTRERVTERMTQVSMPSGITPSLGPVSSAVGEIYRYTLESDSKNLLELSEIQRWLVGPELRQVSGVADVNNFGGFTMEYQLEVDQNQLQRYGLALADVTTAINNNNANAGGSRITRGEQGYVMRGIGMMRNLSDLGNTVVKQVNGVPILVRDLGKLQYSHQERQGILGKDNNPDTIEGIVLLLKNQNASEVIKAVHVKVDELQKKLTPQDVRIVPYIDRDDLIQMTIHKVGHTVLEGVALVCIVLILFLGSPRSALVAAVTIPLALVAVFIMMYLTKMPANLFSLGAIDFGIIVDGAIVVTEAILRRREAKPTEELTEEDARAATSEVIKPIFFATVIIISAYLPLFAFEQAEGKLLVPMAFTVSYALIGALLCSLILVPGLAYMALRKPRKIFHNKVLQWMSAGYRKALARLFYTPGIAYALGVAALVGVLVLGSTAGREFMPKLDEGGLWLQVQMPSGLSLEKGMEMAAQLRRTLLSFPEVSSVVTQLGRSDDGTDPWTPSHMEVPVGLTAYNTWPNGENKAAFLARLNTRLAQLPGFSIGISQPISDMVDDAVGGSHSPLAIRIYGDDFKELRRIGKKIVDVLNDVKGSTDVSIFQEPPVPQMVIDIDRAAIARQGINIADISNLIQTGIGGAAVTQLYVQNRIYNVTVRFPKGSRDSPEALGRLLMTSSSGARIPLSQLVHIHAATGESTITHESGHRQLTIRLDYSDRDLLSYYREAKAKVEQNVLFDNSKYHLEWAGQFENQQRAQARMLLALILVIGLMAVILYAGFGKLRQALLILGVVPLAALGGLIALHLTGNTINVATGVGFIALFGVAVQNGIIMIANINRVRLEGLALMDAVLAGALERFRPVLMTATVASVGMLPAALATGVGTDVQRGLATVVVGGLIVATLLTLFILPTFYFVLERWMERREGVRRNPDAR